MKQYTLSDFDYDLPERLIAQQPAHPRDHARLLVYNRADHSITDDHFYNLPDYLAEGSTLVVNNSKVEKCRYLFGNKEVFAVNTVNNRTVEAMVRPGKKFKAGKTVALTDEISCTVKEILDDGLRILEFDIDLDDARLEPYMHTPFPPYIAQDESLADEYQTVYAKPLGSKAAPTAGLHFTDELLTRIEENGHRREEVTLHVGLGTFAPVKSEDIKEHNMHSEWYAIGEDTARQLSEASHLTAVGTTSVRVLESAVRPGRNFSAERGETDIYITPGYAYKAVDALITNFHLPKSTLLMLVAAFMGYDEMMRLYQHAIAEEYRFYSFGDGMLIL